MLDKLKAKFKDLAERYQTIWGIKKPMLESKPENALKGAYVQVQTAVNDYRNVKDATQKQTAAATLQTRVQAWNDAYQAASDAAKQQFKAQNESVVKMGQQLAQTQTAAPTPTPAGASNGLSGSVGRDADNAEADVRKVQELLKKHGYNVDVDGIIGNQTITAIEQFQQAKLGEHDGIIQPNKGTWKALNEAPSNTTPANENTNPSPATGTSALLNSIQVTGAGAATARQDGLQNQGLTGTQISQTMAKTDEARIGKYKDLFVKVGKEQGVPAGILAALASRETRGNDIIGDGGNGIGIIQVDKRYHPDKVAKILAKQGAERVEESIRQGAIVFKTSWEQIKQKFPNWTPAQQLKGALAAYNAGVSTVQTFENMDKGTTGDDYSSDVWARAQYFMAQGFSEGEAANPTTPTPSQPKDSTQPATNTDTLSGSVGRDADNAEGDVSKVQELLKKHGYNVDVDGIIGDQTITAIEQFQQAKLGEHDGIIQPNKGTWKALLAAPSQDTSANNSAPQTTPDTTGGSYSYYSHPDYTSVKLTYDGKTAYTLNTAADRLIRSALAKAGIFSATITSTKRTYADQARIMKEEVTLAQVAQWYGSDVADAVRSNDKTSLEQWIRSNRPNISNHLSGVALDVVVSDRSAYKKVMNELVPMSGSGVKYHLPEDHGVEHTEFTFPVTNIKD